MTETHVFAHGCLWLRADFHLHTCADREFKVSTGGNTDDHSFNAPTFVSETQSRGFVNRYVAALKEAGIQVGVITNHNKFDIGEFRALRKAARKEQIYLMPGVELSVGDGGNGVHTLVVFHEDWIDNKESHDYINAFLTTTFNGQTGYEKSNARSNHDLIGTFRELDKVERDYLLVFAHVEEKHGLWTELAGGRLEELGSNPLFRRRTAAFQKVRTRDTQKKVQGWLGDAYPSEVEGSDPKALGDIGRGEPTYIKIGAFSFEAVQFALRPDADRLSNQVGNRKKGHSWIRSIRFEGGLLGGNRIDFSAEMNCLIGIRGSGKSAVLESLRYALEMPLDESVADARYKRELVRHALGSGGRILVTVEDEQGESFEIRRILNENADVYYGGELKPGVRIPIRSPLIFGQKELARREEGFERELVERLMGSKLDGVRREIDARRQKVLEVLDRFEKLEELDTLESEYQSKKQTTELRLELFRKHGIDKQLKRQIEFNTDVTNVRRAVEVVEDFLRTFEPFLREKEEELNGQSRLASTANSDAIADVNGILDRLRSVPARIREVLAGVQEDAQALREKLVALERRREALKDEFAKVERKLNEQLRQESGGTIRPDEFVKLNADLQKTTQALAEIRRSRARRDSLQSELQRELKGLSDLWHREFTLIRDDIEKLNESHTALRITPEYKGDKAAFLGELKAHLRGSNLRGTTLEVVLEGHADFISVYQTMDSICSSLKDSGDLFRRYFNDAKAALLTWQVPNRYRIDYRGKELQEHSLGQTASALILFILSQRDNDVIVIDQPEDDLDNQTIYEDVIRLIRSLKPSIQFIFATHNANFPVLGDAEQVCACMLTGQRTGVTVGSIDDPTIREAVVSIMEGGREAFTRRKVIYELWKQ